MDIDIEDALELANQKHQLCLQKKKRKSQQTRSHQYVGELIYSESTSFSSFSSVEMNIQRISSPSFNVDCSNDDYDEIDLNIDEGIQSIDDYDEIDLNIDECIQSTDDLNRMNESLVSSSCINLDGTIEENGMIHSNQVLHPYTNLSTKTFCYRLVQLFHQGKLAKTASEIS